MKVLVITDIKTQLQLSQGPVWTRPPPINMETIYLDCVKLFHCAFVMVESLVIYWAALPALQQMDRVVLTTVLPHLNYTAV